MIEQETLRVEAGPALRDAVERLRPLHDRICPRQVLGIRMGLLGAELLGLVVPQDIREKRLLVFVETDGCFVDGIWGATGCSVGHRTMRIVDHGKAACTFVDTRTGRALRVSPRRDGRVKALKYAPEAEDRWHAQRDGYLRMPAAQLLQWQTVSLTVSLETILSRPGMRVECAACGEEVMNERELVVDGRPYCRGCAGEPYFLRPAAPAAARHATRDLHRRNQTGDSCRTHQRMLTTAQKSTSNSATTFLR